MIKSWIRLVFFLLVTASCNSKKHADGLALENKILSDHNLIRDYSDSTLIEDVIRDINCAASEVLKKRLVLARDFNSSDTSEIILIPFISNGMIFKSSAYSDVENRIILVNLSYIREFTLKNTLNDTISFMPVLELMLLHEVGHFMLKKSGSFDKLESVPSAATGQQKNADTQPEFLTSIKRIELSADSLAIDLVKRRLSSHDYTCLNIAFDIQRIVPGMQFQLSGRRIIDNFGSRQINFLHDPSNDHPNLELRITFMNYFLFPGDTLKKMIDDYIYNRTVAPVHRQEFDPKIFQGQEKKL